MLKIYKHLAIIVVMAACIGILSIGSQRVSAESTSDQHMNNQWAWPVLGRITDTFGSRHGNHKGLDIAAPLGDEIYSVEEGIVKKSYYSTSTYGNVIFIEHPNGYETVYAHLSKRRVKEGERVARGQVIGEVGSTGRSTGPHLHFEVHNGEWNSARDHAFNPLTILTDDQKLVSTVVAEEHKEIVEQLESNLTKGNVVEEEHSIETATLENKAETVTKVTVKQGETLWDLSLEYNVPIESIMQWNHLNSSKLAVGQILEMYGETPKTYTVKEGDSLSVIAEQVGLSVNEIMQLNHLSNDLIFPQQILVIEKS